MINDEIVKLSTNITEARAILTKFRNELPLGDILQFSIEPYGCEVTRGLLEEYGFRLVLAEQNILTVNKYKSPDRWLYNLKGIIIPDNWQCLDVGGGANPWPRANYVLDVYDEFRQYIKPHQKFVGQTICQTTEFKDKQFDFIYSAHVFEHVNNPLAAAKEITRIGKAGMIECPSSFKDGLLAFPEYDHRWIVLPPINNGPLLFRQINREWFEKLQDADAKGAAYRTYIGGVQNIGDQAILRNYFRRIENDLNIIYHWKDELKVKIIED